MIELYLVLSMRFGGKHNYTCEILNTKSSLILPPRLVHLLSNSLVFLTMGMSEVLQGSDYKWEQNNMLDKTPLTYHKTKSSNYCW
jgi:hypothetical protein